jgi:hypothetical protein
MTLSTPVRRVLLVIGLAILLFLAWTGVSGGVTQFSESRTLGQRAQTVAQFAYGIFGCLSAVTLVWGRRWAPLMQGCWIGTLTMAAGLAAVVWGGTSVMIGLLAGAGTFLVALAIAGLLRIGARDSSRREPEF